jgi:hypothetical protein
MVSCLVFSDGCARDTTGCPGECRNMATRSVSPVPIYSSIMLTRGAMAFAMAHLIVT